MEIKNYSAEQLEAIAHIEMLLEDFTFEAIEEILEAIEERSKDQ